MISLNDKIEIEKLSGKDCVSLLRIDGYFLNPKRDWELIAIYGTSNSLEIESLIDKFGWRKFYPNLNP